jgi:hypothetical protein
MEILSGLSRLMVVVVVVMEFVGHVLVLYGARAVGWTLLCTCRTVVTITIVGYGMVLFLWYADWYGIVVII